MDCISSWWAELREEDEGWLKGAGEEDLPLKGGVGPLSSSASLSKSWWR